MIKLSMDDLIKLYKLASIGKLVGGLIHNLNGPMQNLGLDIEMAYYSLKDESKWDPKAVISRIKRMEEEHDKINSLIRSTSARTEERLASDDSALTDIHEFLKQELTYLDTNLYFKHNVQKEIIAPDDPHSSAASTLTNDSLAALSWFLQSLAEELEKQNAKGLIIKIVPDNSRLKISFSTRGGVLSEDFISKLKGAVSPDEDMKSEDMDIGLFLVIMIFQSHGIIFEFPDESSSDLVVNLP